MNAVEADIESATDAGSPVDSDSHATPERGPDTEPNLGAFLLTVAGVTVMFVAVFQFTLPSAVGQLLTIAVLAVTVISVVIGLTLDLLGYFDEPRSEPAVRTPDGPAPWVPTTGVRRPLPPLLDFDEELAALQASFGGEFPPQMASFLDGYRRLKTTSANRRVVASDLRAALNPVSVLVPDDEAEAIVEEIGARLFRYLDRDAAEHLTLTGVAFHDDDGTEGDVLSLRGGDARVRGRVRNEGEAVVGELIVRFRGADGAPIDRTYVPLGTFVPAGTRSFDAGVYVPAAATDADVTVVGTPASAGGPSGRPADPRTAANGVDRSPA